MTRRHLACVAVAILLSVAVAAQRQGGNGGEEGADSSNVRLVGHSDLQGRSAHANRRSRGRAIAGSRMSAITVAAR